MPAFPKFADGGGFVGRVEIEGEFDIEKPPQAQGHIGISGKVEVDLKSVAESASPGFEKSDWIGAVENRRYPGREGIRNDHFFEEPQG